MSINNITTGAYSNIADEHFEEPLSSSPLSPRRYNSDGQATMHSIIHDNSGQSNNDSPFKGGPDRGDQDIERGNAIGMVPTSPTNSETIRAKSMPDSLSRFRRAANQAINARRLSTYQMRGQGVDATDMDSIFSCIEHTVDATVIDTSPRKYKKSEGMNNEQFLEWLKQPRPEWSTVRWININGMSWDVIKAISVKYDLHHLAVEDLLHVPQRTKVDIYPKQTYIACTLLTLMEKMEGGDLRQVDPFATTHHIEPEVLANRLPLEKLDHFKHQYPTTEAFGDLIVHLEQVTIFLLTDGTLITLFQVSGRSVVAPIFERLTHDFNIARKNSDASFLLQSVVDGIVDHAIPITDAFRQEINELETHVLAMPRTMFTRDLHRLSSQLSMLKRTLAPTQALVHALKGRDERSPLSSMAKTYMGDVMDHCNTMVEDIDAMLALCDKLVNMIFNLVSYETNESMKRLALVSIIFLPITFIAGVFGMNFENFPQLKYDLGYFWMICGLVTAVVVIFIIGEWGMNQIKRMRIEKRLKGRTGNETVIPGRKSQEYRCF